MLRQQKIDAAKLAEARSRTPNQGCPLHNPGAPMTPTLRRRAPSPSGSLYGSLPHKSSMRNQPSPASSLYGTLPHKRDSIGSNQSNDYSFKALVKPSVVRPSRWVFKSKRLRDSCRNIPFDKSKILYSLINMRQLQNLFNQSKTWHQIVGWFSWISLFLPVLAWCDHKIVLQIKTKQFYEHIMQKRVKMGK